MDPQRWDQLQAIFHRVVDLPPDQRRMAIDQACHGDAELESALLRLLDEDARDASPLDADLPSLARDVFTDAVSPGHKGSAFGPYRVVSTLGEGGMGVVYLAERADLGQQVAIKVLRDAWVSPARRDRFAAEQRTLARLGHRSIARLYDAGTLDDGTPFFVMEYVEGLTLMAHCRERGVGLDARLALFREVCEAVQHAHQQLIIHRDLKPSNILVARDGAVKLLDFGIAKELTRADAAVDQTQILRLLTPQYAAPEQVRGEPVGIYTDVYALGVLLHELLTDRPPFDVRDRSPREAEALVLAHDPDPPSAAADPSAPVRSATRTGRADLDVMCRRAMHKDAARRYASVDAVIRDLDHYRRSEPLDARADSWRYRAGKFVTRHRVALSAAVATLALVAGLVGFYTIRLTRARNAALDEAARTGRVQRFMLSLFAAGERDAAPAADLRVVALVDRGVREAQSLDRDPAIQAELYQTLGTVYERLGNYERADALLRASLDRRRELLGPNHADVADSLVSLGLLRVAQARLDDAEQLVRKGYDRARATLPPTHPIVANATVALGKVLSERGAYDRAIPILEDATRLYATDGPPTSDLASALGQLADAHYYAGHLDTSDAINRRVIEMDRTLHGPRHPSVAQDLINLGATEMDRGHWAEAGRYRTDALDIIRAWYGEDHPETASVMALVAQALVAQGSYDEATDLLRRALATHERAYGPIHPRVAIALNELASVALRRGDYDEAQRDFERSLAIQRAVYPGGHQRVGITLSNLASVHLARKDFARAETLFREAVDILVRAVGEDDTNTGIAHIKLGRALVRQARYADAEPTIVAGYTTLKKHMSPTVTWLQSAREDLAVVYDRLGQPDKARAFREEHAAIARTLAGK
jgi:serine/threonine-protein kinase